MAKRKLFTFTAPDGTVFRRITGGATYTHAVLYKHRAGMWRMGSCVGRPELVENRVRYWSRAGHECVVVKADHESAEADLENSS